MSNTFFDSNVCLGLPATGEYGAVETVDALLAKMDDAGIDRALVWHVAQHDCSPQDGNRILAEAIAGHDRLVGCWTFLPPITREISCERLFAEMKRSRVAALRAFPDRNRFLLNRVSFGSFIDELCERRVPLLLSPSRGITWPAIYEFLRDYPRASCILCDLGTWSMDRMTWPLLDTYPNVHLETSMLSLHARAIEATVERFGAGRLVFGSGFPLRCPEAPMLQLVHAEIADGDKQIIASGNLQRLLDEVRL